MDKEKNEYSEWLKRESDIFKDSLIALIGAMFASNLKTLSVMGQPFSWPISLSLFAFFLLFRIKYHLLEFRLEKFHAEYYSKNQTNREKSIEQLMEQLYLYCGYGLALSVVHFSIFLPVFFVYLIIDQWYNKAYLSCVDKYPKDRELDWGKGIFIPRELFVRWVYINRTNIILTLSAILAIVVLRVGINLAAAIFIPAILIMDIFLDWLCLNKKFYWDYIGE